MLKKHENLRGRMSLGLALLVWANRGPVSIPSSLSKLED